MQRTIGLPRGTTLVVQPLEVCNANSERQAHDITPLHFDLQTYFTSKLYVSGYGCLIKTLSTRSTLQSLEVCNSNFETYVCVCVCVCATIFNTIYIEIIVFASYMVNIERFKKI